MTVLDDKLVPKVKTIIDRLGKSITYTKKVTSNYDPATGNAIVTGTTSYTVIVSPPFPFVKQYGSDNIQLGDLGIIVPASELAFTPELEDTVTLDQETFNVLRVDPIYSGTSIAAYELQLRK